MTVGYDAHHTKTLLLADWWEATVRGDDAVMLAASVRRYRQAACAWPTL
jgi:hypothetical protein